MAAEFGCPVVESARFKWRGLAKKGAEFAVIGEADPGTAGPRQKAEQQGRSIRSRFRRRSARRCEISRNRQLASKAPAPKSDGPLGPSKRPCPLRPLKQPVSSPGKPKTQDRGSGYIHGAALIKPEIAQRSCDRMKLMGRGLHVMPQHYPPRPPPPRGSQKAGPSLLPITLPRKTQKPAAPRKGQARR